MCTSDDEFKPDEEELMASDESDTEEIHRKQKQSSPLPLNKERKYIVFNTALQNLLRWCHCPKCGCHDTRNQQREVGTLLILTLICNSCEARSVWHSQSYLNNTPAGNILLSTSILFAGAIAGKVLTVLEHMGVACIAPRTFFRHQHNILIPAIDTTWEAEQKCVIALIQAEQRTVVLGGDGRADSPGHCAKYGSYSMLELESNTVVDVQLVQSNECGGSYHMEKEGLARSIAFLQEELLSIDTLITDRHRQIARWIADTIPGCRHLYDIWHVAKGVRKKLQSIAKEKDCEVLQPWINSIVNHLYWCVVSSPPDSPNLILAKWKSVLNHVLNKHRGHDDVLFPKCAHARLTGRQAKKKWLKPSTKVTSKLEGVIMNKSLLRDIQKLSGQHQTSVVEAFHSLIIQFAPKSVVFSYAAMRCRLLLAALHYNENAGRAQAKTKGGKLQHKIRYPKYKKGRHIVQQRKCRKTYRKFIVEISLFCFYITCKHCNYTCTLNFYMKLSTL